MKRAKKERWESRQHFGVDRGGNYGADFKKIIKKTLKIHKKLTLHLPHIFYVNFPPQQHHHHRHHHDVIFSHLLSHTLHIFLTFDKRKMKLNRGLWVECLDIKKRVKINLKNPHRNYLNEIIQFATFLCVCRMRVDEKASGSEKKVWNLTFMWCYFKD